jgi:hypothetical protein
LIFNEQVKESGKTFGSGALPSCSGLAFTRKQVTFVCMNVEW